MGSAKGDMGGSNMAPPITCGSHGSDVSRENGREEDTPPPLPTNSPEFMMRGLVFGIGGCFGTSLIAKPEHVGVIRDMWKCKLQSILNIDVENLGSFGSSRTNLELYLRRFMMFMPVMASMEWMVVEDHTNETLQHPSMNIGTAFDAPNVGPTMFTFALSDVVRFEDNVLPKEEPVDNNYNVTGKDGCLH
jgi:hypothetical protein